jgi:subfamily B ATP-binding cassette protein HlyB/CyaB
VRASFRVLNLGNWASQGVQLVSKLVTAAVLFFGAKAVIEGNLTVGELVAFNMLAGRSCASPRCGRIFTRRACPLRGWAIF